MGTSLVHPKRQSRQYVHSDRDVAYLEKQGWVREAPPETPSIVRDATLDGGYAGKRDEDSPSLNANWDEASAPTRPFKNDLVSIEVTPKERKTLRLKDKK